MGSIIGLENSNPWRSWGVRQLTGRPHVYHGYVGHDKPTPLHPCGHDHRTPIAAERCARRLARKLNRVAEAECS